MSGVEHAGPTTMSRVRVAHTVDVLIALATAVLIFPFPIARAALPLPVFIGSIVATIIVMHVVYLASCLVLRGRTAGMFLLNLGVMPRPAPVSAALRWSLGTVVGFALTLLWPHTLDPVRGFPARWSGLSTVVTVAGDGPREP